MNPWFGVISAVAINICLSVWSIISTIRAQRALRHAQQLDQLLAALVLQVWVQRHQPVWKAWAGIMGEIEVTVTQKRREPN